MITAIGGQVFFRNFVRIMRYWSGKKQRKNFKEFHHPREFENPFFRKGGLRVNRKSWRLRIDVLLLLLTVAGWIYFIFFSPYFLVKNVGVIGNRAISTGELTDYFGDLNGKNIFLIRTKLLESAATKNFFLKEAIIEKIYPSSIKINILERDPVFDIAYNNKIYLIDATGIIFKEIYRLDNSAATGTVSSTEKVDWADVYQKNVKPDYPLVIYNITEGALEAGFGILKEKLISSIKNVFEIEKIASDFKIKDIELKEGNVSQIIVKLQSGSELYFDGELDIAEQINNLKVLYNGKLAGKIIDLKYIDLRFGERVYYK